MQNKADKYTEKYNKNTEKYKNEKKIYEKYTNKFGYLKYIRDSAIHIEDRGRGMTRENKRIESSLIVLNSFSNNKFSITGENGVVYEVEISDNSLKLIQEKNMSIKNDHCLL